MESLLVRMCIDAATESAVAVDKWRRQRRTLERMPSHLAEALLRRLLQRRMLYPSLLEYVFLLNLGICVITCVIIHLFEYFSCLQDLLVLNKRLTNFDSAKFRSHCAVEIEMKYYA